jgi:mannan endo-1,4-beta-mannosidase
MKISLKKSLQCLRNIGFGVVAIAVAQPAFSDWTVQGSQIIDPNGAPFVYRGVNLGILPDDASLAFVMSDIAFSGANAVRIPVQGMSNERLTRYVELCKANRLVCVLTDTSIYGYGDNIGPSNQSDMLNAWLTRKSVLDAYKDYVIVDIASGPAGNLSGNLITQFYDFMVVLLRLQGVTNQLMISGSNWGQDWNNELRDNAEYIRSKDSLKNVIFSVHMYEAYSDPAAIRSYLKSYIDRNLPIVVTEFGPVRRDRTNETRNPYLNNTVAVDSIMATTQELGVGYLGWTWSGYTTNFTGLNMFTSFDPNKITSWGTRLIDGANGIKATAKRATHFASGSASSRSSSSASSVPSENIQPFAVISGRVVNPSCGLAFAEMSGAESKDPNNDPLSYSWQVYDSQFYTYQNFTGRDLNYRIRSNVIYQFILDVEDGRGGRSTATKEVTLNFPEACPPPQSSSFSSRSASSRSFSSSSSLSSRSSSTSSLYCPQGNTWPDCPLTTWDYDYCVARFGPAQCPPRPQSSISSSSSSRSASSLSSSSIPTGKAQCSYVINSQWNNGFTAAIRIKNTSTSAINGWDVKWQYSDGSKVTNLWNATLSGSNPYNAKNLSWNSTIQPGQTVEFGFQGSKSAAAATIPAVTGAVCQ